MRYLTRDTSSSAKTQARGLPTFQIFILFYIQLAEPITSTVIYPFVNDAIRRVGITGGDESKTGFYAGLIVGDRSAFPRLILEMIYPRLSSGIVLLSHGVSPNPSLGQALR